MSTIIQLTKQSICDATYADLQFWKMEPSANSQYAVGSRLAGVSSPRTELAKNVMTLLLLNVVKKILKRGFEMSL